MSEINRSVDICEKLRRQVDATSRDPHGGKVLLEFEDASALHGKVTNNAEMLATLKECERTLAGRPAFVRTWQRVCATIAKVETGGEKMDPAADAAGKNLATRIAENRIATSTGVAPRR